MIEIFKTNVKTKSQSRGVLHLLNSIFAEARINFDLEDCDKILRVEGIKKADTKKIIYDLHQMGYRCEVLE
jgi:tRNA G26 N,N-dimethylase Trm1